MRHFILALFLLTLKLFSSPSLQTEKFIVKEYAIINDQEIMLNNRKYYIPNINLLFNKSVLHQMKSDRLKYLDKVLINKEITIYLSDSGYGGLNPSIIFLKEANKNIILYKKLLEKGYATVSLNHKPLKEDLLLVRNAIKKGGGIWIKKRSRTLEFHIELLKSIKYIENKPIVKIVEAEENPFIKLSEKESKVNQTFLIVLVLISLSIGVCLLVRKRL